MKELILGGARSGKSKLAEDKAQDSGLEVVYIATGQGDDETFAQRIERHRERRPHTWLTIEEPIDLAAVLLREARPERIILIDCLTLWLTNLLCGCEPAEQQRQREALLDCIPELPGQLLMVSNEVSLGVTPMGQLSRDFVDGSGELHQQLAAICDRVTLTVAGLPLVLKS